MAGDAIAFKFDGMDDLDKYIQDTKRLRAELRGLQRDAKAASKTPEGVSKVLINKINRTTLQLQNTERLVQKTKDRAKAISTATDIASKRIAAFNKAEQAASLLNNFSGPNGIGNTLALLDERRVSKALAKMGLKSVGGFLGGGGGLIAADLAMRAWDGIIDNVKERGEIAKSLGENIDFSREQFINPARRKAIEDEIKDKIVKKLGPMSNTVKKGGKIIDVRDMSVEEMNEFDGLRDIVKQIDDEEKKRLQQIVKGRGVAEELGITKEDILNDAIDQGQTTQLKLAELLGFNTDGMRKNPGDISALEMQEALDRLVEGKGDNAVKRAIKKKAEEEMEKLRKEMMKTPSDRYREKKLDRQREWYIASRDKRFSASEAYGNLIVHIGD